MVGGAERSVPDGNEPTGPVRTCIGCRARATRSHLVRIVLDTPTSVAVDVNASAPGRGAWLHPGRACLDQAIRRRAIGRALRAAGNPSIDAVSHWFENERTAGTEPSDSTR
jgi:predicted RNA-binding protein YlxR (DUF448 family)